MRTREQPLAVSLIAITVCAVAGQQFISRSFSEPVPRQSGNSETDSAPVQYPVVIRTPTGPRGTLAGIQDRHGTEQTVACAVCHTTRPANKSNRESADLNEFHQGLKTAHGQLACVACHTADNGYESLHLADGSSVLWQESMQLCAQCHGPQFRDYEHGSHGGMTGFWDLSRGSRMRNHCIDCHDPHAPAFPTVRPAAGPADRFAPITGEPGEH